ncbi:MAG: hypothetical protein JSW12_08050 [Deltaproteobacteria bacterium]|nr:MAG: hypothetical protein JSW12_08050 [Deltaproteobacteria bacterium]
MKLYPFLAAVLITGLFLSSSPEAGEQCYSPKNSGPESVASEPEATGPAVLEKPDVRKHPGSKTPDGGNDVPGGSAQQQNVAVPKEPEGGEQSGGKNTGEIPPVDKTLPEKETVQPEGGVTKEPAEPRGKATKKPLDRRWIIKLRPLEKTKIPSKKPAPMEWDNEEQKTRCESLLASLRETFLKARYHSIQGDYCVTAKHAKAFSKLVENCKRDCPDGLLERSGYSGATIRNLEVLHELGSKLCLETMK